MKALLLYHHAVCKKFGLFLVTFQNEKKKKGRKKENYILFLYNYILRAFHVMIHFSLCVCECVCVWFLPTFQYRTPNKKKQKKKFDNRLF